MNVVVDGLMTSYQKTGSGKVIVLLHGWGDSSQSYAELAKNLSSNFTLLIPDLPGFGGSQAPETAWSLNDYTDFIEHWLKKIDQKKVLAVIAHSYGGSLAIKAVAEGRLKPSRLILLASAGVRSNNQLRKQAIKLLAKAGKLPLKVLPAKQQRRVRQHFYRSIGSEMLLLPHMEQTFKKIINEDVQGIAAQIKTPTLLIYGKDDRSTPVADGRKLQAAINGAQLEVLGGGHFIHQDHPEAVVQLIKDFLA